MSAAGFAAIADPDRRRRSTSRSGSVTAAAPGAPERAADDALAPGRARAADESRPRPAPRPRAELRRRPEHRAAHRPPRRRRSGRPRRRDRRRPRLADAGARRDRRDGHRRRGRPRSRRPCCARSSPTSPRSPSSRPTPWRSTGRRCSAASAGWVLVANLPYNVATPLVCDLLDGVPAIERMLVMVQREVGERLVAAPRLGRLRRGQREGRVLGDGPPRRARAGGGVHAAAERRVGARRDRPPAAAGRRARASCSRSCATAFGQRRKMLRRSLAGVVDAATFAAAGVAETARPEELGLDDWVRLDARGASRVIEVRAPAKLTLTLRITGVRRRRLPPDRRRDGRASTSPTC